jgi:D-alanyl-lipoteichoic acid acyltransferase DltB (MBOAT superfamily)
VYIPLGGSRCSKAKIIRNTFVIFLVSGLWHGANWTFLAWGAYHALLFLPLILLGKNRKYRDTVAEGRLLPSLKELGQMALTFILVVFGWILFRADSIGMAWDDFRQMLSHGLFTMPFIIVGLKRCLSFACLMLIVEWFSRTQDHCLQLSKESPFWVNCAINYIILLVILEFSAHSQSFIYFQF